MRCRDPIPPGQLLRSTLPHSRGPEEQTLVPSKGGLRSPEEIGIANLKGSVDVDSLKAFGLRFLARRCGWTLASARTRLGDPIAMAPYLGKGDSFDVSITDLSEESSVRTRI